MPEGWLNKDLFGLWQISGPGMKRMVRFFLLLNNIFVYDILSNISFILRSPLMTGSAYRGDRLL